MVGEVEWDVDAAVQFIHDNNSHNIALQFPHDWISSAHTILRVVKEGLAAIGWSGNVFLLADIARQGSTVDIVAADHLHADAIIQFGDASREPVSGKPVFHVLRKQPYNFDALATHVANLASSTGKRLVVILDSAYAHFQEQLSEASMKLGVLVCKSPFEVLQQLSGLPATESSEMSGSALPGGDNQHRLWVGAHEGSTTLDYALVACGTTDWSFLDPATDTVSDEVPAATVKMLMRRRFLMTKAETATIVGILISTVAIDGWKAVLQQIKALAKAVDKKTYTVFLGKPAPEKLANFPEVDVWVQISDPAGFVWDSKPYLAPVIAPAEAVQAWQPLLDELTEGALEAAEPDGGEVVVHPLQRGALATRDGGSTLTTTPQTAAEYFLQKRTFTGVETPATGAPVKVAEAAARGLRGRAAAYDTEPPP